MNTVRLLAKALTPRICTDAGWRCGGPPVLVLRCLVSYKPLEPLDAPAADESATRGVSPPGAPPTSPSTVTSTPRRGQIRKQILLRNSKGEGNRAARVEARQCCFRISTEIHPRRPSYVVGPRAHAAGDLVRGKVARARFGHGLARVLDRLANNAHDSSGPSAEPFLRVRAAVGRALGVGVFDAVDGDPERRAVVGLGGSRDGRRLPKCAKRGPGRARIVRRVLSPALDRCGALLGSDADDGAAPILVPLPR